MNDLASSSTHTQNQNFPTMAADTTSAAAQSFIVSAGLERFSVPVATYLSANPGIDVLATSAIVFHHAPREDGPPRVLLVQRAGDDTLPLRWEVPGGRADDAEDATVLHAAARELREETGLRARRLVGCADEAGRDYGLGGPGGVWRFLTFVVEAGPAGDGAGDGEPAAAAAAPSVVLDPREHCRFLWATEAEVRANLCGEVELEFTGVELEGVLLGAFRSRGGSVVEGGV